MAHSLPLVQTPRPRVISSEPMLRYQCNLKGCCCRGWDIPFKLDDFIRLYENLPEKEREELGAGLHLVVDEAPPEEKADMLLRSLKLGGVGEDRHCRFCASDGGCTVHARFGISALPDICVNFPAHGFRDAESGEVELYWDPVCPEVVKQLAEGDEALRLSGVEVPATDGSARITRDLEQDGSASEITRRDMGWHDAGFAQRVANARETLHAALDGKKLSRDELNRLRLATIHAFDDRARPSWELLGSVLQGYRDRQRDAPAAISLRPLEDADAFQAYLGRCIGAHGGPILFWSLRKMERFIYAIETKPLLEDPNRTLAALEGWGDALDRWYFPEEEKLRPLFARYFQHRFGMLYVNQDGELRESSDVVGLLFGATLRYAGTFAELLQRPVDVNIAQAALSAAEYLYRSLHFPAEVLPWFASAEGRELRKKAATPVEPAAVQKVNP